MRPCLSRALLALSVTLLAACGEDSTDTATPAAAANSAESRSDITASDTGTDAPGADSASEASPGATPDSPVTADAPGCGSFANGTTEFSDCELNNYARVLEAPREQVGNPVFMQRLLEQSLANLQSYGGRAIADPSWLLASPPGSVSLNTPLTPLCATWGLPCAGDPFRYPGFDPFYETEALVEPVVFHDRECARLSGRVWMPRGATGPLPTVVIENGSVQAPEPLYWWMAQSLVRAGYAVLTFDPRGQGRSDQQTPLFGQGTNINPAVFWEGLVDAIDFFRSTPSKPYPHNASCAGRYPTPVTAFNPQHGVQDRDRLGIVGHSLGATGVSIVQAYGAPGAEPWPGKMDASNPVDVAVGWDGLRSPDASGGGLIPSTTTYPPVVPRVPSMGQNSEYGLTPVPYREAPARDGRLGPFKAWQSAGVPVFEFTIRGSTHFEWSLIPLFPATSWCPQVVDGHCVGGWGRPMAEHYTLAWLDRWLKQPGETGFVDADQRLLADDDFRPRFSFYSQSARDYPARNGQRRVCADILAGCP